MLTTVINSNAEFSRGEKRDGPETVRNLPEPNAGQSLGLSDMPK